MRIQKIFQGISLLFIAVSFVLLLSTHSVVDSWGNVSASGIEGIFGGESYNPTWSAIVAFIFLIWSAFSVICAIVLKAQNKKNWELSVFFTLVSALVLIACGVALFFEPSIFAAANDLSSEDLRLGIGWLVSLILSTVAGIILFVSLFFTKQRIETTF